MSFSFNYVNVKIFSKESIKCRAMQSIWQNLLENSMGTEMMLQPHV